MRYQIRIPCAALVLVLLAFAPACLGAGTATGYTKTAPAAWVDVQPPRTASGAPADGSTGGTDFLMVDRQVRIDAGSALYSRYVVRLANQSGVDEQSQIKIEYDPREDRVRLHGVHLLRGGRSIDALPGARVETLQRESSLEDGLLDGWLTLHLVLTDVRVGDVLDYSYTIEHHAPEWHERYFEHFQTRWGKPARDARLRVEVRDGEPLYVRAHGEESPRRSSRAGWQVLEWRWTPLPGVHADADRPSWAEAYPTVELSQFADWAEVAAASRSLFEQPGPVAPAVAALAARLRAESPDDAARVVAALRFVQEEIRYTGLELGDGAFRPTPPGTVLARRYGDCKDKALLVATLLGEMGIEAYPALVSTHWNQALAERLPSPAVMDHAIVRVRLGGRTYWLDATTTGQGGSLADLTQADLGRALVLEPGAHALEAIPVAAPGPTVETRTFDLSRGAKVAGRLTVHTEYRGAAADRMRRHARAWSPVKMAEDYLEYYQRDYPGASATAPPRIADDLARNLLVVDESYAIPEPFPRNRRGRDEFHVSSDLINEHVRAPATLTRTLPLSLGETVDVTERIEVRLPEPWNIKEGDVAIDTPQFHYASHAHYREPERRLNLAYEFRLKATSVAPIELATYAARLSDANDDLGFNLQHHDADYVAPGKAPRPWTPLAWAAGALALFWALGQVAVMRLFLRSAMRAVEVRVAADGAVPAEERTLLESDDGRIALAGFVPLGYLVRDATMTIYARPEFHRVHGRADDPTVVHVLRATAPAPARCIQYALASCLADGRSIVTTDRDVTVTGVPGIESVPNADFTALLARHRARLLLLAPAGAPPPVLSLEAIAAAEAAAVARTRERLRANGDLAPTHDPRLDRYTLRGAFVFARAALGAARRRSRTARGGRPLAATPAELEQLALAEYIAVRALAPHPEQGPGRQWGLLLLTFATLGVSLAVLALATDLASAATLGAVLALHEGGHALAMKRAGHPAVEVYFIPLLGALTTARGPSPSVGARLAILLAGPIPGIVLALALILLRGPLGASGGWLSGAIWTLLFINGLNLLPFAPLDGGRILQSLTRPEGRPRLVVAIGGVVGVIALAFVFRDPAFTIIAVGVALLAPRQLRLWQVRRRIAARITDRRDRDALIRAATTALLAPPWLRSSSALRQQTARALVEGFAEPVATGRAQLLGVIAYLACIAFTVAVLVVWATASRP